MGDSGFRPQRWGLSLRTTYRSGDWKTRDWEFRASGRGLQGGGWGRLGLRSVGVRVGSQGLRDQKLGGQ